MNERKIFVKDRECTPDPYKLKCDGIPFVIAGRKVLDCKHGVDHHLGDKEKRKAQKIDGENADFGDVNLQEMFAKSRNIYPSSQKHGCLARIVVKDIISFPEI